MEVASLVLVFMTAVAIAGAVALGFARPVERTLATLLTGEFASAWAQYVKFAVFAATLIGGLRLTALEAIASLGAEAGGMDAGRMLVELYKTIGGGLSAASWVLLAYFGTALVVHGAQYASLKLGKPREGERREHAAAGRY